MGVVLHLKAQHLADLLLQGFGASGFVLATIRGTHIHRVDLGLAANSTGGIELNPQVARHADHSGALFVLIDAEHHDRVSQLGARVLATIAILAGTKNQNIRAAVFIHLKLGLLGEIKNTPLKDRVRRQ